ncbi:hypothetical protein [Ferrimicrobium acidiphilum]|uniref:hypothetical protein n=1 Tax=Ferrimicrobium acidiphilum TaxID=121039 RepID=UPI0023F4E171|nr:hypothetical protein [Ferrimicrobium acidiphilum]
MPEGTDSSSSQPFGGSQEAILHCSGLEFRVLGAIRIGDNRDVVKAYIAGSADSLRIER